jgi:DNA polymerase-3 subunit delta'
MTSGIHWSTVVGQERVRDTLSAAFMHGTLGHAYLFSGADGLGKMALALELSMALLCEKTAVAPCRTCESCRKIMNGTHADVHVVLPVSLEKEHKSSDGKLSEKGWGYLSTQILEAVTDPYTIREHKGIPVIPVEWIKEVNHAILRGPVTSEKIVAILDGIDLMNKESANALLKTLEEPPPGTHIILLTDRIQAVLPTIISRCQVLRFGLVPDADIRSVLTDRYVSTKEITVIEEAVRYAMGSVGRALYVCEQPPGDYIEVAVQLLAACRNGSLLAAAGLIDRIEQHDDMDYHRRVLMHCIFLVRSGFFGEILPPETYIDGDMSGNSSVSMGSGTLPSIPTSTTAERLFNICQDALVSIQAYGNTGLIWAHFSITLTEILHGKQ